MKLGKVEDMLSRVAKLYKASWEAVSGVMGREKTDEAAMPVRPTAGMAIAFAMPGAVTFVAGSLVLVTGMEISPWWAVGAGLLCFFLTLDGMGYIVRCPSRWRLKMLLFGVHAAGIGTVLFVPALLTWQLLSTAGASSHFQADAALRAEPWRRELVAFYEVQQRFPTDEEFLRMHPAPGTAGSLEQGYWSYHSNGDSYEITWYYGRESRMFLFDPRDDPDAGLGWRWDNDRGEVHPLSAASAMAEETVLFERLKASRRPRNGAVEK